MAEAEARAVFASLDTDGNGALSALELSNRLSDFGLGDEEISALFLQLDRNGDGQVDLEEWLGGYGRYQALTAGEPTQLSRTALGNLEADILAALIEARARPDLVAERVQRRLGWLKGKEMRKPGRDVPLITKEGKAAVEDALAFLAKQAPLPGFAGEPVEALALAAADHVADVGVTGEASHSSSDGSAFSARQVRYGTWKGKCGECLWYGRTGSWLSAQDLIEDLIVDDGVASRGHRLCIYDEAYACAGVSVGAHSVYTNMAAIEFATGFEEDAAAVAARQAAGPPKIKDGDGPKGKAFHTIGGCIGCGENIRGGTVIEIPGAGKWHGDCFCCSSCSTPLAGVPTKKMEKGSVWCGGCWAKEFGKKCEHCSKPIEGGTTTAGGKTYHPECWKTVKGQAGGGRKAGGKPAGRRKAGGKAKAPKSMGGARDAMASIGMDYASLE